MTSSPAPDLDELEAICETATGTRWASSARAKFERLVNPTVVLALLTELRAAREAAIDPATLRAWQDRAADLGNDLSDAWAESGRLREALAEACWSEPHIYHSERFGWDFTTVQCRVCRGDRPVPEMPEGWDMRDHQPGCWFAAALLATPPAPSDHGALDVERLARALQATPHGTHIFGSGQLGTRDPTFDELTELARASVRDDARRIAAEYARLATPSVPPEPASPEAT